MEGVEYQIFQFLLKSLCKKINNLFSDLFFFIVSLQDDEGLRANLTLAIAHCSEWGENNYKFGKLNAVAPLVNYMTSKNKNILRGVCIAAYHLSKEPSNCVTMHSSGVIKVRYSNSVIFLLL